MSNLGMNEIYGTLLYGKIFSLIEKFRTSKFRFAIISMVKTTEICKECILCMARKMADILYEHIYRYKIINIFM